MRHVLKRLFYFVMAVVWLVVIPIYAPLAGDSLDWNITQTGFDASRVFMLRV